MKVIQKIRKQIGILPDGSIFKYEQLNVEPPEYITAAKAIERLIAQGFIKRLSTGIFYKPKKTVFGELQPNEEEILKPYLFEKGKRIAYITGVSLYNRMGLTTQIPVNIKIACRNKQIKIARSNLNATPVKSYVDVTDDNFYLLEWLDVLKDFNKIPDLNKISAIKIISGKLRELNAKEIKLLITCCLAYPPRVRSFLGALLEYTDETIDLTILREGLNPFSDFKFGVGEMLSTAKKWRIK